MSRVLSAVGRLAAQRLGGRSGARSAILVGVDVIYELGRGVADGSRAGAIHHGAQVISFERSTHTLFEPALQKFFLPAHWTIDVANYLYLNAQFSVALAFLIWLYLFRNESYYFVRNMFVVAMCLALIGYIGFPTAPPRLFPQDGFVDTVTKYSSVNSDSSIAKVFINPYAAVPSMHCAFALMIGGTGVAVCRHWWAKALVGLLADPDRLGRDRHRQPLLGRLGARLDGRARPPSRSPKARWRAGNPRPGAGARAAAAAPGRARSAAHPARRSSRGNAAAPAPGDPRRQRGPI